MSYQRACNFFCLIEIAFCMFALSCAENRIIKENVGPQLNLMEDAKWEAYKKYIEGIVEIPASNASDKIIRIYGSQYISPLDVSKHGELGCSTWIKAPPENTVLKLSAYIKGENILANGPWFKFRLTIYAKDKNNKSLLHHDVVCVDGGFDWQMFDGIFTVPPDAENLRIRCELTACTGTVWIKDIKLYIAYSPTSESELLKKNIDTQCNNTIVPRPSIVINKNNTIVFSKVLLRRQKYDNVINELIEKRLFDLFEEFRIPCRIQDEDDNISNSDLSIIIGSENNESTKALFKKEFPYKTWDSLGAQGYFLTTQKESAPGLYIGSNTQQGFFYAIQSLRQILKKKGDNGFLPEMSVFDFPLIKYRGIASGTNWFNKIDNAVERMARMKLNFIWLQGGIVNNKFTCDKKMNACWREELNDSEKDILKTTLKLCMDNHIKIVLSVGPRGKPEVNYSSDADIDKIVDKFSVLYEMGFRDFGINFDDLTLEEEGKLPGIEYFQGNIGKAHVYFCAKIYEKCVKKFKGINFYVLPMFYGFDTGGFSKLTEAGKKYLQEMALLPASIELVVCPSGLENIGEVKNIELIEKLVHRKVFIWDNYFCNWGNVSKAPTGITPLIRSGNIADKVIGYMFLPIMPITEDSFLISWWTSADYMWNPQSYDPDKSLMSVINKISKSGKNSMIIDYYDFIRKIYTFENPYEKKGDRINYIKNNRDLLYKFLKDEKNFLDRQQKENINNEISKFIKVSDFLEENERIKPFPTFVKKIANPQLNKDLTECWENAYKISNFYTLKQEKVNNSTYAFWLYDDSNIYVKIVCDTPIRNITHKKIERDNDDIFRDESIELFILPDRNKGKYYHIAVNPAGSIYDEFDSDKKWNGKYDFKIDIKENFWSVEVKIPISDFNLSSIEPHQKWNFNICRNVSAGKKIEHVSYAPLLRGNFNSAKEFWTLEFE